MKRFGEFLLAKDKNAAIFAFIFALLPVLGLPTGFFAAIILGLVTLQKGAKSGLFVLAWIALPSIALLVLHRVGPFDVSLLRCIAVWIFTAAFIRLKSWRLLFEVVTCVGVALIFALHFIVPNVQEWWAHELTGFINQIVRTADWKFKVAPGEFAARLAPMATGLAAFFFLLSALIELLIARYWQMSLLQPGTFKAEFTHIRLGRIAGLLMSILLIMMALKWHVAYDAFPLALLPFFMAGLSLMHYWRSCHSQLIYLLILMYVVLLFLPVVIVVLLALLAFVDAWFNFRKNKKIVL